MATKLTANVKAGGCASKLSPKILDRALRGVPRVKNDKVLVGYDTADDAGVYDLTQAGSAPLAMVQTVDFFTPIVDDPFTFGGIAAANALSDVYAMGGRPVTALSLVVFPAKGDIQDLEEILKGGAEKIHEAGCVILGGHSISDDEVKFGYAVTGLIDPRRVLTNARAKRGDVLVFTKRIGTGVVSTALKKGIVDEGHMEASIAQMLTLNRAICEAMLAFEVHGCTDVTGFGLLGHSREMALASNVTLEIHAASVRFLPGAIEYSKAGAHSGGLNNNRDFVESCVVMDASIPAEIQALLPDAIVAGKRRAQADGIASGSLRHRPSKRASSETIGDISLNPLIIALDVDNIPEALGLIEKIGPSAQFYKVGMELYAVGGIPLVNQIIAGGKQVFLDLKLYDIGETVKRAARHICKAAAPAFLTVHGSGSIMRAAVEGVAGSTTKLLAVTVLTSFDQSDLDDLGYKTTVADLVELRVKKAIESGIDGIVCSPLEVARVRALAGNRVKLVIPGVRSAGLDKGDQKRVATPKEAMRAGADYLVIGRQVTRAADPRAACDRILEELALE
jgi:selenide,water dikinase